MPHADNDRSTRAVRRWTCGALTLVVGCTLHDAFEPIDVTVPADGPGQSGALPTGDVVSGGQNEACARDGVGAETLNPACSLGVALDTPDAAAVGVDEVDACADGFGPFGAPEPLRGIEIGGEYFGPALSPDGLTLYFSVQMGTSEDIFQATRSDASSATFSNVTSLAGVNSEARDGTPFVTRDELELFFYSERAGGAGSRDLWWTERALPSGAFGAPTLLAQLNGASIEMLPWLTADALTLLFVSTRAGGKGDGDIWMAPRASTAATFGEPAPVEALNSPVNEGRAVLSPDGLTAYFSSNRAGGVGQTDLWSATRRERAGEFGAPTNLVEVNSSAADQDVMLSADGRELLFASRRSGQSALWRAIRACL
jgi:WD40-like Beta Propeller Repeat